MNRLTPGCFLFLMDQSESMVDGIAGSRRRKCDALSAAINRFITELIKEAFRGEERPRHYFDVAVIGYCTDPAGRPIVGPAFQGALAGRELVSVVELFENPLEEVIKEVDDGDGGTIQKRSHIWYKPIVQGGTPMTTGPVLCYSIASRWIDSHRDSFPPIVIHITDGEATDADPEPAAASLRTLATNDGHVLLFNCHLSDSPAEGKLFPSSEHDLTDEHSRSLFRMSSLLPEKCLQVAQAKGFEVSPGARGMVFNADSTAMIQLIQIGTVIGGGRLR
jgi:hypothetical protein